MSLIRLGKNIQKGTQPNEVFFRGEAGRPSAIRLELSMEGVSKEIELFYHFSFFGKGTLRSTSNFLVWCRWKLFTEKTILFSWLVHLHNLYLLVPIHVIYVLQGVRFVFLVVVI